MITLTIPSADEDFAALEASAWAVSPIDKRGRCPLESQPLPTPPCFNVTRVWRNTTGTWLGIRVFRDGAAWGEASFPVSAGRVWTRYGYLNIVGINVTVS